MVREYRAPVSRYRRCVERVEPVVSALLLTVFGLGYLVFAAFTVLTLAR